jgi:hypothetical protein
MQIRHSLAGQLMDTLGWNPSNFNTRAPGLPIPQGHLGATAPQGQFISASGRRNGSPSALSAGAWSGSLA